VSTAYETQGEVVTVHFDVDEYSTCDECPDLRWTGPSHAAAAYGHTEVLHHATRTVRTAETYRSWVPDEPKGGEPA